MEKVEERLEEIQQRLPPCQTTLYQEASNDDAQLNIAAERTLHGMRLSTPSSPSPPQSPQQRRRPRTRDLINRLRQAKDRGSIGRPPQEPAQVDEEDEEPTPSQVDEEYEGPVYRVRPDFSQPRTIRGRGSHYPYVL